MKGSEHKPVRTKKILDPGAPPPSDAEWVEVEIELTDEQIAALQDLGVSTEKITIHTYDISRLGMAMPN